MVKDASITANATEQDVTKDLAFVSVNQEDMEELVTNVRSLCL